MGYIERKYDYMVTDIVSVFNIIEKVNIEASNEDLYIYTWIHKYDRENWRLIVKLSNKKSNYTEIKSY